MPTNSVKGFKVGDEVKKYDYNELDNLPENNPDDLAEEVNDLKSELNYANNEIHSINGNYYLDLEKKQRYVADGAETIANNSNWLSLRRGKYINFNAGDVVYKLGGGAYTFRVMTSVDGGSTWVMSSANNARITIENDCIGWISVIKSSAVDDSDIENINNNHIVGILRAGSDSIRKINAEIFAISNTEVLRAKEGLTYVYVNTTATENGGTDDIIDSVPVSKGDILTLKFDAETLRFPNNFNDIRIAVREINSSGTVIKNEYLLLSEKKQIEYTVYYEAAVKLIANINLVRSGETVSTGYYEPVKYTVAVTKGDSSDDVYTEAGQIWEV